MTIKVYDGSIWQPQKSLKISPDGSTWSAAKKGWISDGVSWSQFYPEYPLSTASPSISGSSTQGNILTVSNGTWTSDDAYAPISYAYQWTKGGTDISGATSSTYTTLIGDVGYSIGCRVTATNNRGQTPASSSNTITVQSALPSAPTGLSLYDQTVTPGYPSSVSTSSSATTTASVSWGPGSGTFQSYLVSTTVGSVTNQNDSTRTATITGGSSGTSYTVYVYSVNSSGKMYMTWNAATGATSYDIYVQGSYIGNTSATNYTYNIGSTGSKSVTIYSRNAAGRENTGVSGNVTLNTQYNYNSASGTFYAIYPSFSSSPSASSVTHNSATISWGSNNQSSYSISGVGSYSGSTGTSVNVTGLSASTSYTASVTIYSSTGQSTTQNISFTTSAQPIIPSFTSNPTVTSITTTGGTLSWSSTNQSSYTISAPGTALDGASGYTATSRLFTGLSSGTTYSYTVTITSSTGNSTSYSSSFTTLSAGTAPAIPTSGGGTYTTGTNYVTNAFFTSSSSGTTPITYYWSVTSSLTYNGGSSGYSNSGSISSSSLSTKLNIPQQSWNQSTYGVYANYQVYASNSVGSSGTLSWQV